MTIHLLVIGYGNELRSDDGVGPAVARAVAAWRRPGVQAEAVHQLTPELADAITGAEAVVFVDARLRVAEVEIDRVVPARSPALGHTSDAGWLLGLAELVHAHAPPAWLVTVPAVNLGPGAELSPTTANGMTTVLKWLGSF